MDVGVAADAGRLEAREIARTARLRRGRSAVAHGRHVLVARAARQAVVFAGQRELRLRVVERRLFEAALGVARLAVLLERAAVRVDVARRARVGLRLRLHRRLLVAGAQSTAAGLPTSGNDVRRGRSSSCASVGRVARRAVAPNVCVVRVAMAVAARRELHALERAVDVAGRAGHGPVRAGRAGTPPSHDRTGRRRVLEGDLRRVAGRAVRAERALVNVRVAGRAGGLAVRNERVLWQAAQCTASAACLPSSAKAGHRRVIELLLIERPQLAVHARVLGVAGHAVALHVTVHADPSSRSAPQPARDTSGTSRRSPSVPARGTSGSWQPLERRVRLGEPPGREAARRAALPRDAAEPTHARQDSHEREPRCAWHDSHYQRNGT